VKWTVNSGQCFLACYARSFHPSDRLGWLKEGRLRLEVDSVLVQASPEGLRP
jgi:hypothetical protein